MSVIKCCDLMNLGQFFRVNHNFSKINHLQRWQTEEELSCIWEYLFMVVKREQLQNSSQNKNLGSHYSENLGS